MKQSITISLFLLITQLLSAQITITGDDMPEVNDSLRLSESFLDSITANIYLEAGTDMFWNFEHLVPLRQSVETFQRAISTPYGFFFLGFNRYGVKQFDSLGVSQFQFRDVYQYFKSDNNEFRVEGIGLKFQGVPLPAYYKDEDEIYQFPLRYEDRDSSTFSFDLALPALGSYESEGYRINKVDAWGKIRTPFGEFECIRVVSDIVSMDSVSISGIKIGLPNIRKSYKWLAKGVEVPILEIEGNIIGGNFISTRVRYRDRYRNIEDIGNQLAPTADFSADLLTPRRSDTVRFESTSSSLALHEWNINPNTYEFVEGTSLNSQNPVVIFNEIGSYDVSLAVSNAFGSSDTTKIAYITVSPLSSIRQYESNSNIDLEIFPNPSSDYLYIKYHSSSKQEVNIRIFDSNARLVKSWKSSVMRKEEEAYKLELANFSEGIYFVEIQGKNDLKTGSFIVK